MSIAAQLEANLRARVARNLPQATDRMVTDTQAVCSRRTGALAESIGADDWSENGDTYTSRIFASAPYAGFQDQGTGVFGPTGSRIYPRTPGGVLAFDWPAAGGVVFARSVAGSPGTFFFSGTDGQEMRRRFESALPAVWSA